MTAKTWFTLLRVAMLIEVAIGVIGFLGFKNGLWLLFAVGVTVVLLALGPNYLHPNSDD